MEDDESMREAIARLLNAAGFATAAYASADELVQLQGGLGFGVNQNRLIFVFTDE